MQKGQTILLKARGKSGSEIEWIAHKNKENIIYEYMQISTLHILHTMHVPYNKHE